MVTLCTGVVWLWRIREQTNTVKRLIRPVRFSTVYTTAYWKLTCSVKNKKKNLLRAVYPGPLLIAPVRTFFCKNLFDTNLFFCAGPSAICCSRECGRSQSGEQSSEGQTVPLGCRSRWEMLTRNLTTICCVCILQSNSWFINPLLIMGPTAGPFYR